MQETTFGPGLGRHSTDSRLFALAVLLALAIVFGANAPAVAGSVIFEDSFEVGLEGWATSGSPDWYSKTPRNGAHSIQLRKDEAIERLISTVGYSDITVSFSLGADSLDRSTEVVRALWYDGSQWSVLHAIAGGGGEDDARLHSYSISLPSTAGDNAHFRLRFEIVANAANDYGYVDDVLVRGELPAHTLTVDGQGGGSIRVDGTDHALPWSGDFAPGATVTLEAVPDACQYFTAWSGDLIGSTNPAVVVLDTDRVVTANFAQTEYALTLDAVGTGSVRVDGLVVSLPWSGQYACGTNVTLEGVPGAGWTFAGWSGDVNSTSTSIIVTLDAPKALTATFDQESYTLSLAKVGTGAAKVNGALYALPWSGSFLSGTSVTLEAIPDSGWQFDGWSGDATWGGAVLTVTMDAPKALTATFDQESYTLSLAKVGTGSAKVNGTLYALPWSGSFLSGTSVTLEAIPDSGWQFDGWSGDATWGGAVLTVTMDAPKTLAAAFEEIESFTLSLSKTGTGDVEVNGATVSLPWSATLPRGSEVTLRAVAADGWRFSRWTGDLSGDQNPTVITMDATQDISAKFAEIHHDLSIGAVGAGAAKVNGTLHSLPWSGEVAHGTQVTLEAVPNSGWGFGGWSGGLSGEANPAVFSMQADRSVIATFVAPSQFQLTVMRSGSGSVAVDGIARSLPWSGLFDSGAQVTLEATADGDGQFLGWSGDLSGSDNPITLTMDSDKSLNARFGCTTGPFSDVSCDHWAAEAIAAVHDADIASGYPNGTYLPDLTVTRAAMAVFLARAIAGGTQGVPAGPDEASFSDVPTDHWAFAEVEYVVARSIAHGYGDGSYQPTWQVTRAQMAAFVARAIAEPTGDAGLLNFDPPETPSFSDVPASMWCYLHVEYLADVGVATGYSDGRYRPTEVVTRDQMAVYVARAFGLLN